MISKSNINKKEYNTFYIYSITNPNGSVYVGVTNNIVKRMYIYKNYPQSYCNQSNIYKSMIKYGYNNHKFDILLEITENTIIDFGTVNNLEQKYIKSTFDKIGYKCLNTIIKGLTKEEMFKERII